MCFLYFTGRPLTWRLVFAFSRYERTPPNFVSQAPESENFLDCKLAAPGRFFRRFEPRFRVHLLRHASATSICFCGFFRGFQRFEVFFEQVFHSDCIRQKRECSPNADGVRFFGRAKTNYIIAKHVYTRRHLFAIAHF